MLRLSADAANAAANAVTLFMVQACWAAVSSVIPAARLNVSNASHRGRARLCQRGVDF